MHRQSEAVLPTAEITLFPARNVQLGWRGTPRVGAGMANAGNTCYLNSTLQALFHVPAFINWLQSDDSQFCNCTHWKEDCIICAMNKTLKASQAGSGSVIIPLLIYKRLDFICQGLTHGEQEDAHEFMRCLLGSMEQSYLTRYQDLNLDSYSRETTPLNQIFGGYIRTTVTCLQCCGVSTTFQHFQDLILDIRRASTLDDALAAYFCVERLEGEDAYRCGRCYMNVSATKKFSLEKSPHVLCIQFKRFGIMGEKINKHVSFPMILDLTKFLWPQPAHRVTQPLKYHLVSMVTHVGLSVHRGHYTAVAQTRPFHYYEFDDSSVRALSLSAVLDTNAYILMYERKAHKSDVSATVTSATCSANGRKRSLSPQGTVSHEIGSVLKHKQGRAVLSLHQPDTSPTPPRLVLHRNDGAVYRSVPQLPLQRQEQNVLDTGDLILSCESEDDESSSQDSGTTSNCSFDMTSLEEVASPCQHCDSNSASHCSLDLPSLDRVVSPCQHSTSVFACSEVPTERSLETHFCSGIDIPTSGKTADVNECPEATCTAVGKCVLKKKAHTIDMGVNLSRLNVKNGSEVKMLRLVLLKMCSTPLRPKLNGLLKRYMKIVHKQSRELVPSNRRDCGTINPLFLLAYRALMHETTGMTPASLVLSRELRLSSILLFGALPYKERHSLDYAADWMDKLPEMDEHTHQSLKAVSNRIITRLRSLVKCVEYQEGRKMWLYGPTRTRRRSSKSKSAWKDP
jgi:ubiquitin carboxyl-terminal hydrolase 36/42